MDAPPRKRRQGGPAGCLRPYRQPRPGCTLLGQPTGSDAERSGGDRPRERFQFVKTYKHDYVVRITCAGQTSYWYKRFSESNPSPMIDGARTHGGSQFLCIRPGNYSAQVTVFAAEGFRLDFEIAFRVDSPPAPAPDRVAALASIAGPQDIARQDRRRVDTPQP